MLHFRNLFNAREEYKENVSEFVASEYIWFYDNLVRPSLVKRCKENKMCLPFANASNDAT
jgi:hypothetical protein